MKKLLVYLLLIACFESFISSETGYCYQQKNSGIANINVSDEDKTVQLGNADDEIYPPDIFSFRYF